MKKILLYTLMLFAGLTFLASCEDEEIGTTETVSMAGEWYVTVKAVDADENIIYDDPFGNGTFHLDTYNTASNSTTEMWIDDNENFWEFKNRITVDLASMTFYATDAQNETYDCLVDITNGQILYDAATTPSGSVADSIVFNVSFSDDGYPAAYGYDHYRIEGFRYTGLTADE